ncbi:MAG: histidine phosphatase family protein [Gaiellales bacterium]
MATTIHLVRHGETDWNRGQRIQGHTDVPLNDAGRRQAIDLGRTLAHLALDAVYSSDLSRASETAERIAEHHNLPVVRRPALREKHFGSWEGLTDAEVHTRFPDARAGQWGDGETTADLARRVVAMLAEIARAHPGETVLVVTHGGVIRAAHRHAGVEPGRIGNCAVVTVVAHDDGKLVLEP